MAPHPHPDILDFVHDKEYQFPLMDTDWVRLLSATPLEVATPEPIVQSEAHVHGAPAQAPSIVTSVFNSAPNVGVFTSAVPVDAHVAPVKVTPLPPEPRPVVSA